VDTVDIELGKAEQELLREESALFAELARLEVAGGELTQRAERLIASVSASGGDAGLSERVRAFRVPSVAPQPMFDRIRDARNQAIRVRREGVSGLRQTITKHKAQLVVMGQQLTHDEKLGEKLAGHARARQREQSHVTSSPESATPRLLPTMPTPPPGLKPAAHRAQEGRAKRAAPRVSMQAVVDLHSDNNFFQGFSANISDGGLFIATVKLIPIGTQVDLTFSVPPGDRIEAKGEVRWVRDINDKLPDSFPGVGIQFVGLSEVASHAINRFLTTRDPLFYPDAEG
jgi:uncharacterized protein (TIGR02266 family)